MSRLWEALTRPRGPAPVEPCRASGWWARRACTHRAGQPRCPVCDSLVEAPPSARYGGSVRVIEEHPPTPAPPGAETGRRTDRSATVTAAHPATATAVGTGHTVAAVPGRRRADGGQPSPAAANAATLASMPSGGDPYHPAEVDPTKAAAVRHYAALARQAAALRALRELPRRPRVLPVDRLETSREDGLDE